jgi:histidyl-tRNA synthetase
MNRIQAVKGTREFYPEDMALRNFIHDKVGAASESFGYQQWDGPFLEAVDLYAAKSGEELVTKQSFVFEDRGGDLVTLRPELTPSLARMIAARQNELTFPLRWWSFGPFWRYEQPQKGRTREFFQWNLDMLGADSPEADAELIAVAATFLRSVGLGPQQAAIYVNDRRLANIQFERLGIPGEKRNEALGLVDRRAKMAPDKWEASALEIGLSRSQIDSLKAVLADFDLWKSSPELRRLFSALEALGVKEFVKFGPEVTRGLLYYTGIVFEAFETTGSVKRAILGGGRYDNLLADVGGKPMPATGFAMGDVVIGIVLKENGLLPSFPATPAPILVTVFDEALWMDSYALAGELRKAGLNAMAYPEPAKLPKQFKYADKMKMQAALVLGPDEAKNAQVVVKNLSSGSQETVGRDAVVPAVRRILESARRR